MDAIEIAPDPPLPTCLVIPFNAELVLPGRSLTGAELLQSEFPNPFTTPYYGLNIPVWLDLAPSDINPTLLLSCPVPHWDTVKQLLSEFRTAAPTSRSLNRAAVLPRVTLPNQLPIWVLSFWDHLSEAYDAHLSWKRCHKWVNRLCVGPQGDRDLIEGLGVLLRDKIAWHGYLTGKRRDRGVKDIFDLLSNNLLDTGQINDLLELIERRLVEIQDDRTTSHLIAPTELAQLILYSHQHHTESTYQKQFIQRSVEEELIQGHRSVIASIAWVPVGVDGHWIAYVVDPLTSTIFHGDSLGGRIPENLQKALEWWLHELCEKMGEQVRPPNFEKMSITGQEDGFSCGILSTNSLLHHLLPHRFPLVPRDRISIKRYRIERTVEILKLSVEPVCMILGHCMHALIVENFSLKVRVFGSFSRSYLPFGRRLPQITTWQLSPLPQLLSLDRLHHQISHQHHLPHHTLSHLPPVDARNSKGPVKTKSTSNHAPNNKRLANFSPS